MPETWPADLPQCLALPYSGGVGNGVVEHSPDIGPPIRRRRTSSTVVPLSGTMPMTPAQFASLKTFFDVTLDLGALPFSFPDPDNAGETLLVMFASGNFPSWQKISPQRYMVSISLAVLP